MRTAGAKPSQSFVLTVPPLATRRHCVYCFDALIAHLTVIDSPLPEFEDANCALFVTWNKTSNWSSQSQLRGCIGTLEPRKLHTALKDYALTSALRDSRFSPVQLNEVSKLSCSVSLLTSFEQASSWQDWQIGTHGLIIEFTDPALHCKRTATFLPEVAADQGWSQRQCIESLIRKAGYHGPATTELLNSLWITRYQSSKAGLSFADYAAGRYSRLATNVEQLLQKGSTSSSRQAKLAFA
eukprot:GHRR01003528.1.p1 GENE.GHRR01003528.1~~GHRR01003528.1.p1  ORF type:complete len:240 (+),score=53.04 GHRR01003528.1:142-861(+)